MDQNLEWLFCKNGRIHLTKKKKRIGDGEVLV